MQQTCNLVLLSSQCGRIWFRFISKNLNTRTGTRSSAAFGSLVVGPLSLRYFVRTVRITQAPVSGLRLYCSWYILQGR